MSKDTAIIILAAGASTRLGRSKQLVKYKGQTLIRRAVETSLSVCPNVVVVLGDSANEVEREIADLPVIVSLNEMWEHGMGWSIAHGVRAAQRSFPDIDGILIHLCDLPFLESRHIQMLLEASESGEGKIVFSVYDDFKGVPAFFPLGFFEELLAIDGDHGAQNILKTAEPAAKIGVKLGLKYFDIDDPEDLESLFEQQ